MHSAQTVMIREFEKFLAEFASESDRAAVILGAAKLDVLLFQLLQKVLRPSTSKQDELLEGDVPLGTFSARAMMCYRLGLIDDEVYRAINLVRRIRNSFAHELSGVSLESGGHRDRVQQLVAPIRTHGAYRWMSNRLNSEGSGSAHDFRVAVALIAARLEGAFDIHDAIYLKKGSTKLMPTEWDEEANKKQEEALKQKQQGPDSVKK